MKGGIPIVVLISILILASCKLKQEASTPVPEIKFTVPRIDRSPSDLVMLYAANSVYGEWQSQTDNIFYSPRLKLNRDGSFEYVNQGCTKISVTKGTFVNKGPIQVLTSLDEYKNRSATLLPDTTYLFWKQKRFTFTDGFLHEMDKNGQIESSIYFRINTTANN